MAATKAINDKGSTMPNWTTNVVAFSGPPEKVSAVREALTSSRGATQFDFNTFRPTPERLLETPSPVRVLATQDEVDKADSSQAISAETAAELSDMYGAYDWYEWRVTNWGTKWPGSQAEVLDDAADRIVIRFDTPWVAPGPLLAYLADTHELEITGGAIHEDGSEFQDTTLSTHVTFGDLFTLCQEQHVEEFDGHSYTYSDRWIEMK